MRIRSISRPVCGATLMAALLLSAPVHVFAHDRHVDDHGHDSAIGQPGKAADVSRTIEVVMTDNHYSRNSISVAKGETVRFRVVNKGSLVHEFDIGTAAMHARHRKEMMVMVERGIIEADRIHHDRMAMSMKMPGGGMMTHDDPNSVLLEPGQSGEVIWKFSTDARLEFACNMPGHYESGMKGRINIR